MKRDDSLLTHMADLSNRAQKTGMAHSKFLTPRQVAEVEAAHGKRKDISLVQDGGFPGAERRVAIFLQPDWGAFAREEVLAALALQYREQDALGHRDILGAVLGLGLSREVLGDIHVQPGSAKLVCLASMADYIRAELRKAGRVGLTASRVPLDSLPDLTPALREEVASVASLRLDAVVAAAFHLSRQEACDIIRAGLVSLAHEECASVSKAVEPGDILSIRGKGRAKVVSVDGLSRKGRQRITLGFYG